MWAYHGASTDELQAAARAFDAQASADEDKIAPKLAAYQLAKPTHSRTQSGSGGRNFSANVSGWVFAEGASRCGYGLCAANMLSGLTGGHGNRTHDNDLILALLRARDQLQLAREANALIRIEQATIAAIDDLQRDLERLKPVMRGNL